MEDSELDRLQELTNIGAGHAASAFAMLTRRTVWMTVPRAIKLEPGDPLIGAPTEGGSTEDWTTGVFFEFEGYLDAVVGILFHSSASEEVIRCIVGMEEGELLPTIIESALMEVGNILASHVASAIADTVGERLLPSIPTLAMNHAEEELRALVAHRKASYPVRIECELVDGQGEIGGLLIMLPEVASA